MSESPSLSLADRIRKQAQQRDPEGHRIQQAAERALADLVTPAATTLATIDDVKAVWNTYLDQCVADTSSHSDVAGSQDDRLSALRAASQHPPKYGDHVFDWPMSNLQSVYTEDGARAAIRASITDRCSTLASKYGGTWSLAGYTYDRHVATSSYTQSKPHGAQVDDILGDSRLRLATNPDRLDLYCEFIEITGAPLIKRNPANGEPVVDSTVNIQMAFPPEIATAMAESRDAADETRKVLSSLLAERQNAAKRA